MLIFCSPKAVLPTSMMTIHSVRVWKKCVTTATPPSQSSPGTARYAGTVSEGDFLWQLLNEVPEERKVCSMKDLEQLKIRDILQKDTYPPVRITVSMEEMLNSAMNQNFIPVVDDLGNFNGIVTRKDIIRYFAEQKDAELPQLLQKIV